MNILRSCLSVLAGALVASGLSAAPAAPAQPQFQVFPSKYKLVPVMRHSSVRRSPQLLDAYGNSTNWSGYAAETNLSAPTLGAVTYVYGGWTVPKVTGVQGSEYQYSSTWVGIDGLFDSQLQALFAGYPPAQQQQFILATQTVEQLGTEQDWTGSAPSYYAWFEFYPNYAWELENFTVKAGDGIAASVTYTGSNQWTLKITNFTRKETATITGTFTADRYSAEWIQEAPSSGTGILPLADFGTVKFTSCAATLNGKYQVIGKTSWEAIDMVSATGSYLTATTSALNSAGNAFSVKWDASQ